MAVARVMLISTAAASATYRLRVCVGGVPLTWFRVVQQIIKEECGKMHAQLRTRLPTRKRKDVRGTLAIVSQRRIS